jgi:hypothetical protein
VILTASRRLRYHTIRGLSNPHAVSGRSYLGTNPSDGPSIAIGSAASIRLMSDNADGRMKGRLRDHLDAF